MNKIAFMGDTLNSIACRIKNNEDKFYRKINRGFINQ